jgi:glutathione synthase
VTLVGDPATDLPAKPLGNIGSDGHDRRGEIAKRRLPNGPLARNPKNLAGRPGAGGRLCKPRTPWIEPEVNFVQRALILVSSLGRVDGNHALFANAFRCRNWEVCLGLIDTLACHDQAVDVVVASVLEEIEVFGAVAAKPSRRSADDFDLIWIMNQPHERLARDAWQILWGLAQRIPFVNSVEGLLFLNNKSNLGIVVPPANLLESHVANEFESLWQLCQSQGGTWIVKPPNQDCGWNVFLIEPGARNARALLQSMTGNSPADATAHSPSANARNQYCVLQRYTPGIVHGEKRVILAGGQVMGQHGRVAAAGEHRSNMAQGGKIYPIDLTTAEADLCLLVAERLARHGVLFAGIDLCYPHVLEINLVNPGGLEEVLAATGRDLYADALKHILQRLVLPEARVL